MIIVFAICFVGGLGLFFLGAAFLNWLMPPEHTANVIYFPLH